MIFTYSTSRLAGGHESLIEENRGHVALGEYTIWAMVAACRDAGAAPFGSKGAGFLRCAMLSGDITDVATWILLLSGRCRRVPFLGARRARDWFVGILGELDLAAVFGGGFGSMRWMEENLAGRK